jgi:hypothetical protein
MYCLLPLRTWLGSTVSTSGSAMASSLMQRIVKPYLHEAQHTQARKHLRTQKA